MREQEAHLSRPMRFEMTLIEEERMDLEILRVQMEQRLPVQW
jgi:hypothetical protein